MVHPNHLIYTPEHLWVDLHDGTATVGVTDDFQHVIEAIESIDLPLIGDELEMDMPCIAIHQPNSDLVHLPSPLTGRVIAVNKAVIESAERIFISPYKEGWLFKMEVDEEDEIEMLLTAREYTNLLEESEE